MGLGVLATESSPEAAKTLRMTSQNGRCGETSKCEKLEKFVFRANQVKEVLGLQEVEAY